MDEDDQPPNTPLGNSFSLGICEDSLESRLASYHKSDASPVIKMAGIIDCFIRLHYPNNVCEEGTFITIVKSLFSQKYRDEVLTRFYDESRILPQFFLINLDKHGYLSDLYQHGNSLDEVMQLLRESEGYVNKPKEIEKLDSILHSYHLLQDAGMANKRIMKTISNMKDG